MLLTALLRVGSRRGWERGQRPKTHQAAGRSGPPPFAKVSRNAGLYISHQIILGIVIRYFSNLALFSGLASALLERFYSGFEAPISGF